MLYNASSDKKASTYHRLFTLLLTKCGGLDLILDPRTVIVDFELIVHNVVRSFFPSNMVKGCLFHYGQALWHKLLELGLSSKYGGENGEFGRCFRLFFLKIIYFIKLVTYCLFGCLFQCLLS